MVAPEPLPFFLLLYIFVATVPLTVGQLRNETTVFCDLQIPVGPSSSCQMPTPAWPYPGFHVFYSRLMNGTMYTYSCGIMGVMCVTLNGPTFSANDTQPTLASTPHPDVMAFWKANLAMAPVNNCGGQAFFPPTSTTTTTTITTRSTTTLRPASWPIPTPKRSSGEEIPGKNDLSKTSARTPSPLLLCASQLSLVFYRLLHQTI
ncbi:unnamed protein product, partial [Mesorhabditis spiculigera]